MKLEEAIKIIKDIDTLDDIELQEAYETVLHELEHLQKENEELKDIDLTTVHIKGVCDEKNRWRNKIREKIKEYKNIFDMGEEWYTKQYIIEVLEELLK